MLDAPASWADRPGPRSDAGHCACRPPEPSRQGLAPCSRLFSMRSTSPAWLQRPVLVAALLLSSSILTVIGILSLLPWYPPDASIEGDNEASRATSGLTVLDISGVEALLEVPASCKGVLLVAHGCMHSATDFWTASSACTSCAGLPEEVNITKRALDRGYAVVAVSSSDRQGSRCWQLGSTAGPSTDMLQVQKVLQQLDSPAWPQLQGRPQYALGASSGGAFVLALAAVHPLAAVASQIMATSTAALAAPQPPGRKYPPTMFIHMPRDQGTAQRVAGNIEALHAQGVATLEVKVHPQAVTAAWLQHKLGLEAEAATQVHAKFREAGILGSDDMQVEDPRRSAWRDLLRPGLLATALHNMSLEADLSPISEVLNVAFAGHEIVSDTTDAMLDWFEALVSPNAVLRPVASLVLPHER